MLKPFDDWLLALLVVIILLAIWFFIALLAWQVIR